MKYSGILWVPWNFYSQILPNGILWGSWDIKFQFLSNPKFYGSEGVYLGGKLGKTLQGPSDLVGGEGWLILRWHYSARSVFFPISWTLRCTAILPAGRHWDLGQKWSYPGVGAVPRMTWMIQTLEFSNWFLDPTKWLALNPEHEMPQILEGTSFNLPTTSNHIQQFHSQDLQSALRPSAVSFGACINALGRAKQWQRTLGLDSFGRRDLGDCYLEVAINLVGLSPGFDFFWQVEDSAAWTKNTCLIFVEELWSKVGLGQNWRPPTQLFFCTTQPFMFSFGHSCFLCIQSISPRKDQTLVSCTMMAETWSSSGKVQMVANMEMDIWKPFPETLPFPPRKTSKNHG